MPEMMKAQVFYEPEKMALEERPVPEITPDQVLVKVHATGICGSDVAYYFGKSSLGTDSPVSVSSTSGVVKAVASRVMTARIAWPSRTSARMSSGTL